MSPSASSSNFRRHSVNLYDPKSSSASTAPFVYAQAEQASSSYIDTSLLLLLLESAHIAAGIIRPRLSGPDRVQIASKLPMQEQQQPAETHNRNKRDVFSGNTGLALLGVLVGLAVLFVMFVSRRPQDGHVRFAGGTEMLIWCLCINSSASLLFS